MQNVFTRYERDESLMHRGAGTCNSRSSYIHRGTLIGKNPHSLSNYLHDKHGADRLWDLEDSIATPRNNHKSSYQTNYYTIH